MTVKNKKRRFGVTEDLSSKIGEMIKIGENQTRLFRDVVIPCSRIEPDPDNPRRLAISKEDLTRDRTTLLASQQDDLAKLEELSESIKISGLINPIVVVKNNEKYRIIAGERRFLASLIAGKQEIDARVFDTKPGSYELKLIQWFENTEREDLSIIDRIDNIKAIIAAYQIKTGEKKITAQKLGELIGLSRTVAFGYLSLINAPKDVEDALRSGILNRVDTASLIANTTDPNDRAAAILALTRGASFVEIKQFLSSKRQTSSPTNSKSASAGISLGKTKKLNVLKTIVDAVTQLPPYQQYASTFEVEDWMDPKTALGAFKRLIDIMECEE